jgi:hypothetical protein
MFSNGAIAVSVLQECFLEDGSPEEAHHWKAITCSANILQWPDGLYFNSTIPKSG